MNFFLSNIDTFNSLAYGLVCESFGGIQKKFSDVLIMLFDR